MAKKTGKDLGEDMDFGFGKDEFFPLDDSLFDSDDTGIPKDAPKEVKGVKGFFKNVAKSTKGLAMDVMGAQMPNVVDFGKSLKDVANAGKDSFSQAKLKASENYGKYFSKREGGGDIKTTIKDLKQKGSALLKETGNRLKTGDFYHTDEENTVMDMGMFGGEDDFGEASGGTTVKGSEVTELGDEPFGETRTSQTAKIIHNNRKGRKGTTVLMGGGGRATAAAIMESGSQTSKTMIDTASAQVSAMSNIFARQFEVDEERFRTTINYQHSLLESVNAIGRYFSDVDSKNVAAAMEYRLKDLAIAQDQMALLKDIKSALYVTSPQYSEYQKSKLQKILSGGGGLNGEEYFKNIKGNALNALGSTTLGTMFSMGKMAFDMKGDMKDMGISQKFDPMSSLVRMGFNSMLSDKTKQKMGTFNDIFSNAGGLMIGKMNQIGRFSKNPLVSAIATALGVKDGYMKQADLGLKDPDAKAQFDMKTHRTINEVIPGYLSKMLAATSGDEETFYDYKTGAFKKASSIKKKMERDENQAYNSKYELTQLMGAMTNDAVTNNKLVKEQNLDPGTLSKDMERIKRNIIDSSVPFTISQIFTNKTYQEQLIAGTKYKLDSLKVFADQYEKMSSEEQLSFEGFIVATKANVDDYHMNLNEDLKKFGGATIASDELIAKEQKARKKYLKYSNTFNQKVAKGSVGEMQQLAKRKAELQEIENMGGEGIVHYSKGMRDSETGKVGTSTSAGIWHNIYQLLLKGIIVYPQQATEMPAHLRKALSSEKNAAKAFAENKKASEASAALASEEIRQLSQSQLQRQMQLKTASRLGFSSVMGLNNQRKKEMGTVNQSVNKGLNAGLDATSKLLGAGNKSGSGYGVIGTNYEDSKQLFATTGNAELGKLGALAANKDAGGIKGKIGQGANFINQKIIQQQAKVIASGKTINDRGEVVGGKSKIGETVDQKKEEIISFLRNKGVFDKADEISKKLFWEVKTLSPEETDAVLKKARDTEFEAQQKIAQADKEANKQHKFNWNSVDASVTNQKGVANVVKKTTNKTINNNTNVDMGQTNIVLSSVLDEGKTFHSSLLSRVDYLSSQMALLVMASKIDDKQTKDMIDNVGNNIGKLSSGKESSGKGFFKRMQNTFAKAGKKTQDILIGVGETTKSKFAKKDKQPKEKKKKGLFGKLLGFGGKAIGFGGKAIGGIATGAVAVGGKAVGLGKRALVGGGKKVDEAKSLAREVTKNLKQIQIDTKGMSLKDRIKYVENRMQAGFISSKAGSFIIGKWKEADKLHIDLDQATSGMRNSLKENVGKAKTKSKGILSKASKGIQGIFKGAKPVVTGAAGAAGGIIGGAVTGAGKLLKKGFGAIKGFIDKKKAGKQVDKETKSLARDVANTLKQIQATTKGMPLKNRIKYVENLMKTGLVSSRAGSFIIGKWKEADKKKLDLDASTRVMRSNIKEKVLGTKKKAGSALKLAAIMAGGAIVGGGAGAAVAGGGFLAFKGLKNIGSKIKSKFGKNKGNKNEMTEDDPNSSVRREGSLKDFELDKKEAHKEHRDELMFATLINIDKNIARLAGAKPAKEDKKKDKKDDGLNLGLGGKFAMGGVKAANLLGGAASLAGVAAVGYGAYQVGSAAVKKVQVGSRELKNASAMDKVQYAMGNNGGNYDANGNKITDKKNASFGIGKARLSTVAAAGAVLKASGGIRSKFVKFIGDILTKGKIGQALGRDAPKIAEAVAKRAVKNGFEKVVVKIGSFLAKAASGIGLVIIVAQTAADFISGMASTSRYFRLPKGIKPTIGMQLTSGVVNAISGFLFGLIPTEELVKLIFDKIGSKATKDALQAGRDFGAQRAKILGVDPDRLTEYETKDGMDSINDFFSGGKRSATILGFGKDAKGVKLYNDWKTRRYKPVMDIFDKLKHQYGDKVDQVATSDADRENQKRFREAFLKEADMYVKQNKLENLRPGGTSDTGSVTGVGGSDDKKSGAGDSEDVNKVSKKIGATGASATGAAAAATLGSSGGKMSVSGMASGSSRSGDSMGSSATPGGVSGISSMSSYATQAQNTMDAQSAAYSDKNSVKPAGSDKPKGFFAKLFKKGKDLVQQALQIPVVGRFSSFFGYRSDPFGSGSTVPHRGLDIAAPIGTVVKAFDDGVIYKAEGGHYELGNFISIDHGNNLFTIYGHLNCIYKNIKPGYKVTRGEEIAEVGTTGNSTGPHLHFSIMKNGVMVDPQEYVAKNGQGQMDNLMPTTNLWNSLVKAGAANTAQARKLGAGGPPNKTNAQKTAEGKVKFNPNATGNEEVANNIKNGNLAGAAGAAAQKIAASTPNDIKNNGTVKMNKPTPNSGGVEDRMFANLKESSVITGARNSSESINMAIAVTKMIYAESIRHNKVSETFYQSIEDFLKSYNDRIDSNEQTRKMIDKQNKLRAEISGRNPAQTDTNKYSINDFDRIATGY